MENLYGMIPIDMGYFMKNIDKKNIFVNNVLFSG